jgi:hypothetical protein
VQVAVATDLAARCRPAQSVAGLHQVSTASPRDAPPLALVAKTPADGMMKARHTVFKF